MKKGLISICLALVLILGFSTSILAAPPIKTSLEITNIGVGYQGQGEITFDYDWSKLGPTDSYTLKLYKNDTLIEEEFVDLYTYGGYTRPVHNFNVQNDNFLRADIVPGYTYKVEIYVHGKGGRETKYGYVGYAYDEITY